jgi:thiol-disulfide isomerase/thioredoxin
MDDALPASDAPAPHEPRSRSRWSTVAWLGCSLLLVALVVGVWLRVDSNRASKNLANAIIAGTRPDAPALPTKTVHGAGTPGLPSWYRAAGGHQSHAATGAQVLVVNHWASWCGPCKDEAPELRKVAHDYDGRVTVVGLNAGSEDLETDARAFIKQYGLDFSIVRGTRADKDAWGVDGYPETFIVGTDGRISSFVNGPIDSETLRGLLDDELRKHRS